MRFKITWANCEYRVSIPSYKGGEVVTADEHDAILTRHAALVEAVAWLRGVDDVRERFAAEFPWIRRWSSLDQYMNEARSEVDRLIADCKGEE